MKFHLLASTLLVTSGLAAPASSGAQGSWVRVALPAPENWIAGPSLFPGRVIKGNHGDYGKYTSETWAAHVLKFCKESPEATSANSYSDINSGTPKIRVWFGYCFRGNATTVDDYERETNAQGSVAYTICD